MSVVSEQMVRSIVEEVVAQLRQAGPKAAAAPGSAGPLGNGRGPSGNTSTGSSGVHASVDDAVAAATEAFGRLRQRTIEERGRAIQKIRDICIQQAEGLGRMEMDETRIGRLDHKIDKLRTAGRRTPGIEFLRCDAYSGDNGLTVVEYAPFGVIGAVTPVTHSLPTLASNAINMLAAGNTVVFNAHPSGAHVAREGVRLFNEAIRAEIGIDNLVNLVDPPSLESAQALFAHEGIRLLVVTGGPAVARAALASRKRAIVAGPGNPCVVVDETACIDGAARSIVQGASYDNNLLCIGEKEVFAVHSIVEPLLAAMAQHGGFRLTDQQFRDLEAAVFAPAEGGAGKTVLKKEFIGQDPAVLARAIGVSLPPGVQVLFAETSEHSPFVDHEQMMPVVPFVRVPNVDVGIELAKKYEHNFRHTAIMHSRNVRNLTRMGRELDTTLFVKNGPCFAGLGIGGEGYLSFSIATPTGEGVTNPLTFTRQRRCSMIGELRII